MKCVYYGKIYMTNIDNNDIFTFDFDINYNFLLSIYKKNLNFKENYNDNREDSYFNNWKIIRHNFKYAQDIIKEFTLENLDVRPRFYVLDANSTLKEHIDLNTQCSLNFILNNNTSPININNNSYNYKNCLLNTTQKHYVINNSGERIIFKLSIMNCSFDMVKNKIKNVLQIN